MDPLISWHKDISIQFRCIPKDDLRVYKFSFPKHFWSIESLSSPLILERIILNSVIFHCNMCRTHCLWFWGIDILCSSIFLCKPRLHCLIYRFWVRKFSEKISLNEKYNIWRVLQVSVTTQNASDAQFSFYTSGLKENTQYSFYSYILEKVEKAWYFECVL